MKLAWVSAYVAATVLVNFLFIHVPPIQLLGATWTVGSIVVGAVFVLRDYAQRDIGHRVLVATFVGAAITALMSPRLAFASGAAFLLSELLDWAVFSKWPGSMRSRIVASSLVGCPVDSAVFMALAGFFSWTGVAVMTASKLIALAYLFAVNPNSATTAEEVLS